MIYAAIKTAIAKLLVLDIAHPRKLMLNELAAYARSKMLDNEDININFICTHNSRRSHLSQIWAQVAAAYYEVPRVNCYSGGTEATALFPQVIETLSLMGFKLDKLSDMDNPIYMIKYAQNSMPIIGFSKVYDHAFNPVSAFAAVMTCSQADNGCPFIAGAEKRIPITFEDPKTSDGTPGQQAAYMASSLQIASEMCYVFSMIKK